MARINIEDKFWEETQGLIESVGDRDRALGNLLRFIKFSQGRFKENRVVTETDFKEQKFLPELKEFFARPVDGGGYMVAGAEKYFGWLRSRSEAGRKGGKAASGDKKSHKKPNVEIIDKSMQANTSKTEQVQPSYSPSLSEEKNTTTKIINSNEVKEAWEVWVGTLNHFNIKETAIAPPQENSIFRAIKQIGFENVLLALEGQRYEPPGDNFKPENHLSIDRVLHRDYKGQTRWEKLKNMALAKRSRLNSFSEALDEAKRQTL